MSDPSIPDPHAGHAFDPAIATDADLPLPPRRETFLVRYPRNVKMIAATAVLAVLVLPPAWIHGRVHRQAAPSQQAQSQQDPQDIANLPTLIRNATVAETDVNAASLNDQDDRTVKLAAAPDSRVTMDDAEGSLPRIGETGLRPWQVYARPFNAADKRPRIAIVVADLGLARMITDQAISQLPPTVTLAFSAQSPVVGAWGNRARQDGHEILLQVPMEPFDFPRSDPGPNTLLTTLPNSDNIARLLTSMRRMAGYVGITTLSGSRFTTDSTKLAPVVAIMRERGLLVLDAHAAPHSAMANMAHEAGIPVAVETLRIGTDLNPDALTLDLNDLEKTARVSGRAVGIVVASPIALNQLQAWLKDLPKRGVALAPISAMVQ